jgi:molybdopterin converting factor small subunit
LKIEVRLYATLRAFIPEALNGILSINMSEESTVEDLLNQIQIDKNEVHMLMVNGTSSSFTQILREGDRVGLFPPVGGG